MSSSRHADTADARRNTADIGMPLVKEFVEACGGSISIESRDRDKFPEDHGTAGRQRPRIRP